MDIFRISELVLKMYFTETCSDTFKVRATVTRLITHLK